MQSPVYRAKSPRGKNPGIQGSKVKLTERKVQCLRPTRLFEMKYPEKQKQENSTWRVRVPHRGRLSV